VSRERFVTGPAGRLRVLEAGDAHGATPIVFLHGLGGASDTWGEALTACAVHTRALAFDARGHGGSDRPADGTSSVAAWCDDLLAVLDEAGLTRAVLVAHSFAGLVLQAFATRAPERCAGLVFVDAVGDFSRAGDARALEAWREADAKLSGDAAAQARAFDALLPPFATAATRARTLEALGRFDARAWGSLRAELVQVPRAPTLPPVPTLAIEAGEALNPVRFAAAFPQVPCVRLPGTSHWLQLDAPARFAATLVDFLRRQGLLGGLEARAAKVKLVVFDVDGVLTDGGLWYGPDGEVMKRFDVKDGHAMVMARLTGLPVAILTARQSRIVETRAKELKLARVYQGRVAKGPALDELCAELGVTPAQTAYMGDDLNDLSPFARVALAACPADATFEVQAQAHFVSAAQGGRGAARELLELVLRATGRWDEAHRLVRGA
jgi:3-deoxy-D-manno-octulosonate 8-phosphate phosphatase (KDO 8-P phosphatase)